MEKTLKEKISQKVLLDLFCNTALLPATSGLTLLIASSFITTGFLAVTATGIGLIAIGAGIFSTKLIFGLEDITKRAYELHLQAAEEKQEEKLDELLCKLKQDRDSRPERCLQDLRAIKKLLKSDMEDHFLAFEVMENFNKLLDQCVRHIKETDDLWRASKNLSGDMKKKLKKDRERLVEEVENATDKLIEYANSIRNRDKVNSNVIQESLLELERSLEVARRTEERLSNITYNPKEFE